MEIGKTPSVTPARLAAALSKARGDLLDARNADGVWRGELASSALSTATAISALSVARGAGQGGSPEDDRLIDQGVVWLMAQQNGDGGWGDTDRSFSNLATTWLTLAATELAEASSKFPAQVRRGQAYVRAHGSTEGLRRRYGRDKTFAVPILTNCAIAGLIPWSDVSPLPFELACAPQQLYRWLQMPVVSYAIPALIAIGLCRYHHGPPRNPLMRAVRAQAIRPVLRVLQQIQPESGGYLEAVPLTSFVVMSLGSSAQADHPVVARGLAFLRTLVRNDGSWPIDIDLATWNTSLTLQALAQAGDDIAATPETLDWLLSCQRRQRHPFTGAAPGGWGWTDRSGAVPDADDTPAALLALRHWTRSDSCRPQDMHRIETAAEAGVMWLLGLQNRDGGWPTFCRGWGKLPFDRSGCDLTAHAMRALRAWPQFAPQAQRQALARSWKFLHRNQQPDGCWLPLWFGNQHQSDEANRVYGTAKVLLAAAELQACSSPPMQRAITWLQQAQNGDGGWSGGALATAARPETGPSSVEETAVAVEALAACRTSGPELARGVSWLVRAVEENRYQTASPIGFYFAKLWYHEALYPTTFTVSGLGRVWSGAAELRLE